jgi:hypothetical protein
MSANVEADPRITNALLWGGAGRWLTIAFTGSPSSLQRIGKRRPEKSNVRCVARKSKAGYRWGTFRGITKN